MEKFRNRYRIDSTRLQNWDYGWKASYFITICTNQRRCYFGHIESGIMHLSEPGTIAKKCWLEIPEHYPSVELSDFVIMPNHVHGILSLTDKKITIDDSLETRHALSLRLTPGQKRLTTGQKRFQNQGKNTVSSIIGGFKSATTRNIHLREFEFQWQDRFWDHVIRDNNEFDRIRNYIIQNPAKWTGDDFFHNIPR